MASFDEVLKDCTKLGTKIPTNEYLKNGKYPVIDQGQSDIAGYHDSDSGLFENVPAIVFGDHTRAVKYVDKPCFLGADGVKLLCPLDKDINCKYLFYQLSCADIPNTGYNRHFKWVKALDFKIPSSDEQNHVVEVLDKVTELISLRKQQLAKLDELVKARFVEMFGDPSSNPMGWLQTTVGAECYYIKDGPHKSLTDVGMENGYPFISVRNIVNGYIDFSTAKYISEADYKDAIKKCCPEKGDILYSKGGTTGIAKLVDIDIKFANWVHLAVLKFNHNEFNGSFFEKMLNCDYCYKQSQMLTKGIANRDLVLSAMAQIKIYKPPILLQNQFAAFVERVDQQKQSVQKSLDKLELMKKALMQEYFG